MLPDIYRLIIPRQIRAVISVIETKSIVIAEVGLQQQTDIYQRRLAFVFLFQKKQLKFDIPAVDSIC